MATIPTALDNSVNSFEPLFAQPPAMSGPPPSVFAKLPLELRQLVYHYVLVEDSDEKVIKVALNDTQLISDSLKNAAGAILVNKSMSNEVLNYAFSMFGFSLSDLEPSSYSILQKFCDRIGKKNVELIKEITIPHLLAHDVDSFQWNNFDAEIDRELYWAYDIYIYNRIFELQDKRLLSRLPSLKTVKVGLNFACASNVLVRLYDAKVPKGIFESLFSLPGPGFRYEVFPGLLWLLAEFRTRDIDFGIYWTDVWQTVHISKHGDSFPMTEEQIEFQKCSVVDVLNLLHNFVQDWKTCPVSNLGTLPDDLFAYGISDDYLDGTRPHLCKE
ncbi:hypothetical protein P171DRAFT_433896 [Karstenula rhodostoma CBS 690.94]|uniref:F-box domain-containing protein n=1 Tax=Karstenula rhodostoma CBS 690.94 TaxID=1392251 RepID=A0A9P4U8K1_9PLEO|nr:hypothetical protein P171DRAFT_433896 [Karstenula rhodostoma CBS 690.94]